MHVVFPRPQAILQHLAVSGGGMVLVVGGQTPRAIRGWTRSLDPSRSSRRSLGCYAGKRRILCFSKKAWLFCGSESVGAGRKTASHLAITVAEVRGDGGLEWKWNGGNRSRKHLDLE